MVPIVAAVRLFAQALLIQSVLSQCIGRTTLARGPGLAAPWGAPACGTPALAYDGLSWTGNNLAYEGLYAPAIEFSPTSGGALPVSSASNILPVGLAVESENVFEGALAAAGELPFVGTVAVEGVLPTAGAGAVNHNCGNGVTGMVSQNTGSVGSSVSAFGPNGIAGPFTSNVYAPGVASSAAFTPTVGYRYGLTGLGPIAGDLIGAYPAAKWAPSLAAPGLTNSFGLASPALASGLAPYGGAGEGNVAVAGELPVAGSTAVAGQVPIVGAVNFEGPVAAAGAVSIGGNCACGCGSSLH